MITLELDAPQERSRESEVARLVHFIQTQDAYNAETMILRFRQRGEQISREILKAYRQQIHGSCYAI